MRTLLAQVAVVRVQQVVLQQLDRPVVQEATALQPRWIMSPQLELVVVAAVLSAELAALLDQAVVAQVLIVTQQVHRDRQILAAAVAVVVSPAALVVTVEPAGQE